MDPFIGEIRMAGFGFTPTGWMPCDGRLLSTTQYSALYSLLGFAYGGDRVTTFALPDLRGRSPVSIGDGMGLTPVVIGQAAGTEQVTLDVGQMPLHSHNASVASLTVTVFGSTQPGTLTSPENALVAAIADRENNTLFSSFSPINAPRTKMAPAVVGGDVTIGVSGGNASVPIRNPYLGLNFIIAVTGIYPSHSEE